MECLERLRIVRLKSVTFKLKPTFQQLHVLEIWHASIEGDKTLFAECSSLVDLKLIEVKNCSAILENFFPKLELFSYRNQRIETNLPLSTFISSHKNLKTLILHVNHQLDIFCNNTILLEIDCCEELEILDTNIGRTDNFTFLPLEALKSLKKLSICCGLYPDFTFLSALTNLDEFCVELHSLPDGFDPFVWLAQLRKSKVALKAFTMYVDHHYVKLTIRDYKNSKLKIED